MKFKKFTDIENSYREKYIAILRQHKYDQVKWIATEKIDGANFSFITDGKTVAIASRSQLVSGDFYHCQSVIDKYSDKVKELKQIHFASADQIQVYGELFGPGIQSRIFYGNEKEFMAFDIAEDGVIQDTAVTAGMLTYVGIPTPPTLGVFNNLDEALAIDNVFVSKVYDDLYPGKSECQFDLGENDAEGVVLRPVEPVYTPNGSRVMLKYKTDAFKEKGKRKKRKDRVKNEFIAVADQYINLNRMNAVLSKEGNLEPKDFGRVIKLMYDDVVKDMIKDGDLNENWKKEEGRKVKSKGINLAVSKFLKENLLAKL